MTTRLSNIVSQLAFDGTTEGAYKGWISRRGGSSAATADLASNYAHRLSSEASTKDGHELAAKMHQHAAEMHRKTGNEAAAKDHDKIAKQHNRKAALSNLGFSLSALSALVSPTTLALSGTSDGALKGWEARRGSATPEEHSEHAEAQSKNALKSSKNNAHWNAAIAHQDAADAHRAATYNKFAKVEEHLKHDAKAKYHDREAKKHYDMHENEMKTRISKKGRVMSALSSIVSQIALGRTTPAPAEDQTMWLACSAGPLVSIDSGPNSSTGSSPEAPSTSLSYCKDVLANGSYKHPVHGWKLNVDDQYLDKLCAAFDQMQADGVKVPIYADHKPSTQTHLGYLSGVTKGGPEALKKYPALAKLPADKAPLDPTKLYAIHDFSSPEAAKMAQGVGQVSVLIDKKFKGGNGKEYGEAIRHCAVTPEPVVGGQKGFCQMAASRDAGGQDDVSVFVRIDGDTSIAETNMLTETELALARTHFPESEQQSVTTENAVEKLGERFVALSKAALDLEAKVSEQGSNKAPAIDPEALDMLAENTEVALSNLVAAGKITPAVKTKLQAILIGSGEARNVYALSRNVSKTPKSIAASVIDALKDNDAVVLGEKTRAQTISLSRQVPGEAAKEDEAVAKAMDEAANRGRGDRNKGKK